MAISKNPYNPLYFGNRAQARIKLKKYIAAINDCNRALDLDITNSKFLYRKALALSGLHM
jgi:DnaJ family protein C protein 7